jgi:hypothetical protein
MRTGMETTDQPTATEAPARKPLGAAWIALIVFAILFVAYFFRGLPLQLDPVRASNTAEQFDTTRALDRLSRVLDGTPHPNDSAALDETRARLIAEIERLGYTPTVHDDIACRGNGSGSLNRCGRVQNITFGTGSGSGPALLLTAHYDSVEASPGFGDDGIGLAVWLEVAHHLKQNPPTRPVLFLITDGEEAGLLGAGAFVDKQGYGAQVGRIINLEARGVRGPAMMFETSHPNAGVVSDWAKNPARPFSNSMMTAVYELLPNSTDLTVHLDAGFTGINIAISDGLSFYHTAHDDLERLDRRSVQHMGDQALGATRAFLAADWSIDENPNADMAYSDIATRGFIALPETIATLLLGLCFGLSALLFMRPSKAADWKRPDILALALPPAVILVAAAFSWASATLIGLLRPEPLYWIASPQGLNSVFILGTLISSALGLAFVVRKSSREAIYASGWLWFLIVGVGLTFAVPGFSMIFLVPAFIFVIASVLAWAFPRFAFAAHAVACAFLILIFFPIIQLVEVTMGLGMAAAFGLLQALVIAPSLGLIGPINTGKLKVFAPLGALFLIAAITTLILPAFTSANPLALNFVAHYDLEKREAKLLASAPPGALPKFVMGQLTIEEPNIPGVIGRLATRPLDFTDRPSATMTGMTDGGITSEGQRFNFKLSAPGARMVRLRIPAGAYPVRLDWAGATRTMTTIGDGYYVIDCVGRACDGADIAITFNRPADAPSSANPLPWMIQGFWSGLPPEAQSITAARGDAALPIQMGDVTIVTRTLPLVN